MRRAGALAAVFGRSQLAGVSAPGAGVMVTSHLGRPEEGKLTPADSLAPVAARLAALLGTPAAKPEPKKP